jgi:dipeptidyl aminopeptidase/acylaminoacyl peptidase
MRTSWIVAGALWATAGLALAQTPAAPPSPAGPPPLEAYGRLPSLEEVQISPDGTHIAFVQTDGDTRLLVVKTLADQKVASILGVGKNKLRSLKWADDTHLLIIVSTTAQVMDLEGPAREWYLASVYDIASKKQHPLFSGAEFSMNVLLNDPDIRVMGGKTYAFVQTFRFEHSEGTLALYRVDLTSGMSTLMNPGDQTTDDWFVDKDGKTAAEVRYSSSTGRWALFINRAKGGWTTAKVIDAPLDPPWIAGYSKDGQSVLIHTTEDHKGVLHPVSLADGAWGEGESDDYDHLYFDDTSRALIGGYDLEGDVRRVDFFEPQLGAIWKGIEKAYPGERVRLASWSRDHRKIVVVVDGARDGYIYALVDLDTKKADWLGDIYPEIPVDRIAQPEPFAYKAADGLEIPAYLTLPVGAKKQNLPLIVFPHGGPADRDSLDFDWLREALVSRGYAVLQPNFRGSSGYPDGFLSAGYGQWGRKMQTDLSDGVRALAAKGIIDPKRVCIFGWSYGGYAALAGATLDPGVYRCAADMAGPSDLRLMLQQVQTRTGQRNSETLRYWDRFMGVQGLGDASLDKISPAQLAAKAEIPILIVHGKDDTVVEYRQSLVMADALKRAGKPYSFVTLDGEDHWGSRGETRVKLLQAVMEFLVKNNPPDR